MTTPDELHGITDFPSLVAYLRDELDWEIPEDLPLDKLTYSYTADELGLNLDAQVEITQLRPILGQAQPWGVFFVDFDKAELPVTLLRRILSGVSRKKRASANPGDRALFEKNDLLFVSAFGKADDRRLALAHFHQERDTTALPTLRVLAWDRQDTTRHMKTVAERLDRLRWPDARELTEAWKSRWAGAFIDRPREAIRTSKEMATALADCAKQIRGAIQEILPKEKKGQPLTQLFEAVKATLNKDLDEAKFADTYAQTIAYGLLSKRIDQVQRWRAEKARTLNGALPLPPITADALETAIPTNPFLSELLTSFMSAVGRDAGGSALDFDELGLGDLIDLLNTANMEAVLDDFDKDKQGDDPVIHFYEGFLAAYDKAMKVQRGVFYTPKPVVSFIVRSVDEALRTEFDLPLGLADTTTWGEFVAAHPDAKVPDGVKLGEPFLKILDPATGTGTFLVEVIDLIHHRMTEEAWKGKPAEEKRRLWNAYVAEHLLPRLYGYELMMAPYAVAHMKIGLKLADTGYDFSGTETGPDGKSRPTRARVFLTNALEPAQDLDMQLAFMNEALAHEAKAANDAKARTRFTVVVGNPPYSSVSAGGTSFSNKLIERYKTNVRREETQIQVLSDDYVRFIALQEFVLTTSGSGVGCYITNNNFYVGKVFRDMRASLCETFSVIDIVDLHGNSRLSEQTPDGASDDNVFDIVQGVGVSLFSIPPSPLASREVSRADLYGTRDNKYDALASSWKSLSSERFVPSAPRYLFVETVEEVEDEFHTFVPITNFFGTGDYLLDKTKRYGSGFKTQQDDFAVAMSRSQIASNVEELLTASSEAAIRDQFKLCTTSQWSFGNAQKELKRDNWKGLIRSCVYRPFDLRWTVYHRGVISNPRTETMKHIEGGQSLALCTMRGTRDGWRNHALVVNRLVGKDALSPLDMCFVFPMSRLLDTKAGLGERSETNVNRAGVTKWFGNISDDDLLAYLYALLYSPTYQLRYNEQLRRDFARIPLPNDDTLFANLVPLGAKLVSLHLLEADALPDPKVRFASTGGEPRLGRFNKEVRRDASGRVYLNDQNWFATVPEAAWEHWIGGYQPAQKWLKDRAQTGSKDKLKPGRLLTTEDILHYRRMIVALEETGKVMAEIDKVIADHGGWPGAFRGMTD